MYKRSTLWNVVSKRKLVELMDESLSAGSYIDFKFIVRVSRSIPNIWGLVKVAEDQLKGFSCVCMVPKGIINSNIW